MRNVQGRYSPWKRLRKLVFAKLRKYKRRDDSRAVFTLECET